MVLEHKLLYVLSVRASGWGLSLVGELAVVHQLEETVRRRPLPTMTEPYTHYSPLPAYLYYARTLHTPCTTAPLPACFSQLSQ